MKKLIFKTRFFLLPFLSVFFLASCSNDDGGDATQQDLIVGTWKEIGDGFVFTNGDDSYEGYTDECVLSSRFTFMEDNTLEVMLYELDEEESCELLAHLKGNWSKISSESSEYQLIINETVYYAEGEDVQSTSVNSIEFMDNGRYMLIKQDSSNEQISYSYDKYEQIY